MKILSLSQAKTTEVSHNPRILKQQLLHEGELGPITNLARAVFPPGEIAGEHSHPDMGEVFMVESGQGEIAINGEVYPIGAGSCVVVDANERHEIRNTGQAELLVIYFGVRL